MNPGGSKFSRRDFLKLGGTTAVTVALEELGVLKVSALEPHKEDLNIPEVEKSIDNKEWFYPFNSNFMLVPINPDWTYDDTPAPDKELKTPVKLFLREDIILQIRNIKDITTPNGDILQVGEIPLTGDKFVALTILEDKNGRYYSRRASKEKILSGFTYTAEQEILPNQILNTLQGVKNLLEFQRNNNGFTNGRFSFLEIEHLLFDDPEFINCYNAAKTVVPAGGISACATTLSKSLYELTQQGKAKYIERSLPIDGKTYFCGPTAPEITELNSDASIQIAPNRKSRKDFIWEFKKIKKMYLWAEAAILPNTNKWDSKKMENDCYGDARLILTLSWRETPPPIDSVERIVGLRETYKHYRVDGPNSVAAQSLLLSGSQEPTEWKWYSDVIKQMHPESTTDNFKSEIDGADEGYALQNIKEFLETQSGKDLKDINPTDMTRFYCSLIYYFKNLTDQYARTNPYTPNDLKQGKVKPTDGVGTFFSKQMATDGIYFPLKSTLFKSSTPEELTAFEKGLIELNDTTYKLPNQPVQCLGWVSFLGRLGLPLSPTYVGGYGEGNSSGVTQASGLLSNKTREALKKKNTVVDEELEFWKTMTIDEVEIGDSFVRYGGNNNNHIGTVIAKKKVKGKTVLLITDSNRKQDGMIRVLEVNSENFRVIFGEGESIPPVVIRNKHVLEYLNS